MYNKYIFIIGLLAWIAVITYQEVWKGLTPLVYGYIMTFLPVSVVLLSQITYKVREQ